ncbi:glycine/betaine ABC transporter substrate-binding protein [Halalkalibacillus sediminis]|uniref:Glycine/betaine ABC transporter substrate-binding protein n=1 Tax=Halalkalibacillus sediminis TaxID=2018042 RepID=A0A2I0QSF4_9BACI|nr:glycine betaine ABC transporter substrate-binding protein [Halalkalibacillus sediminis]PKR77256.1 glycine/betaine ABC transporter substrate-binding protein [Halalkalibacillus sediminis]
MKKNIAVLFTAILLIGLLSACGVLGGGSDSDSESGGTVTIGGKPWTEQYILPYIIGIHLEENTDFDVQYEEGLGEVAILTPAIDDGDIDVYVEYTGTGLEAVLNEQAEEGESADSVYDRVKEGYEEEFNVTWLEPLGFENTYTLAYHPDSGYDADTYSDLVETSKNEDMIFGAPHAFYEREGDGYDAMLEVYPFEFTETESLDANVMYEALESQEVDLIPAFTTDGRIERYNLETTEDDQGFFPKYDAVPLVRQEALDENPGLKEAINELAGQISEEEMQEMNARVDIDGDEHQTVAREFLKEKGIIE